MNVYEIKKGFYNTTEIDNSMIKVLLEDGVATHLALSRLLGRDVRDRLDKMAANGEIYVDKQSGLGSDNRKNVYYMQNYNNKTPMLFTKARAFELAGIAAALLRERVEGISAFASEDEEGHRFTAWVENAGLVEINVVTRTMLKQQKKDYGYLNRTKHSTGNYVVYMYENQEILYSLMRKRIPGLGKEGTLIMHPATGILGKKVVAGVIGASGGYKSYLENGLGSHPQLQLSISNAAI